MNKATYEKAKAYEYVSKKVKDFFEGRQKMYSDVKQTLEYLFPELAESEDERIRKWCISHFKECINVIKDNDEYKEYLSNKVIAWLEKQGEPNWVHHKVDLSDCSEEYRKAYYDGWNNCNKQHSQLKDEQKPSYSFCQENCKGFQETGKCFADGECKAKKDVEQNLAWSSEDEKIAKELIDFVEQYGDNYYGQVAKASTISWLEKQGEQKQKQYDIDVLEKHITKDSISELAHTVIVRNGWEIVDAKEQNPVENKDAEQASKEYREMRERYGVKDPIMLDEIEEAYYEGATRDKKHVWSEEDKKQLERAIYMMEQLNMTKSWDDVYNWLKSIKNRVQPHWKPTDEQMNLLREVQQALLGKDCHNRFVNFMYDLKKL